jgi:hypothetical protein
MLIDRLHFILAKRGEGHNALCQRAAKFVGPFSAGEVFLGFHREP